VTTSRTHFALASLFCGLGFANALVARDWGGGVVALTLGMLAGFNLGLGLARSEAKP